MSDPFRMHRRADEALTVAEASQQRAVAQRQHAALVALDEAFDACADADIELDVTGNLATQRRGLRAWCLRRIAKAERVLAARGAR